jgi:hypothetical protein
MEEVKSPERGPEKKRSFGKIFLHFLMYGGWLVIVILGLTIMVFVSKWTQS